MNFYFFLCLVSQYNNKTEFLVCGLNSIRIHILNFYMYKLVAVRCFTSKKVYGNFFFSFFFLTFTTHTGNKNICQEKNE